VDLGGKIVHIVDGPAAFVHHVVEVFHLLVHGDLLVERVHTHGGQHGPGDIPGDEVKLVPDQKLARHGVVPPRLLKVDIGQLRVVEEQSFERKGRYPRGPSGDDVVGSVRGHDGGSQTADGAVVVLPSVPGKDLDLDVEPVGDHVVPLVHGIGHRLAGQLLHGNLIDGFIVSAGVDHRSRSAEVQLGQVVRHMGAVWLRFGGLRFGRLNILGGRVGGGGGWFGVLPAFGAGEEGEGSRREQSRQQQAESFFHSVPPVNNGSAC